jgi:ABC-type transport system involved in cytochrome bd biosynthesis fused ATPase/permease subunit
VALVTSERSSSSTYLPGARVLGVISAAASISLAVLSALALSDLAHRAFTRGLVLLLLALLLRGSLALALDEWDNLTAARLRTRWRRSLVGHFVTPRRGGERARSDLSLAVDHASEAPSLERLRVSAAVSLLGVVVVFVAAGWLPLVITLALLALAVPFYQRAGRRSEVMAQEFQRRRATLEERQLEVLQHAPELRALGAVTYGANEIAAISESEHVLALRAIRVALESSLVTEFLSGVSIGLVAMVVGFGLLGGRISLLRALIALLVTSELFAQVRRFGVEFHRRDDAQRALTALVEPDTRISSLEGDELLIASNLITEASPGEVTLRIRASDRVLVTGPSGSGKTTLLHSLLGWRGVRGGVVERSIAPMGYVDAESALLSGTLRENVTVGADVPDEVVREQLRSLGLVGSRFDDLDSELLSDGRGMSSGERVRLLLARALLAHVSLLILDDVAGVLDEDARLRVRASLAETPGLAILEATVDTPLLEDPTLQLKIPS